MNLKQLTHLEATLLVYGTVNAGLQKIGQASGPSFEGADKANLKEFGKVLARAIDLIEEIGTEDEV